MNHQSHAGSDVSTTICGMHQDFLSIVHDPVREMSTMMLTTQCSLGSIIQQVSGMLSCKHPPGGIRVDKAPIAFLRAVSMWPPKSEPTMKLGGIQGPLSLAHCVYMNTSQGNVVRAGLCSIFHAVTILDGGYLAFLVILDRDKSLEQKLKADFPNKSKMICAKHIEVSEV